MRISRCRRRNARDPLGHPLAGQREEQQRQRRADGEGQRQRHRVEPDGSGGARDDDGGEHRARARARTARRAPARGRNRFVPEPNCFCGSRENGFSRSASNCGKINPRPIATSATSADPADRVLGQMQQRQQCRTDQGDDAEAEHQAGDHAVGPQRFRQRALGSGPSLPPCPTLGVRSARGALRAGEEDDRQHRQDAR